MSNEVNQKIFTALIGDASSGNIYSCHAIEYKSHVWLVPQWLEAPTEGYKIPARIIQLAPQDYQRTNFPGMEFSLSKPIPKAVLDGQTKDGYEVIERPDIRFSIPKGVH